MMKWFRGLTIGDFLMIVVLMYIGFTAMSAQRNSAENRRILENRTVIIEGISKMESEQLDIDKKQSLILEKLSAYQDKKK